MTLALLPVPLFKATDANGLPLALGKLYSYAANSSTPQALLAADGTTSLANPVILDASGQAELRLGPNAYKLDLYSALDVHQSGWPVDNVSGLAPTVIGDYSATAAQMRLTTDPGESGSESLATSMAGELERLRYAIYDGHHALDPALTYWYETPYGSGAVNVKSFGAVGDGVADDTAAFAAALAYGAGRVEVPYGEYRITATLTITNAVHLVGIGAKPGGATSGPDSRYKGAVLDHDFSGTFINIPGINGNVIGPVGTCLENLILRQVYGDGTAAAGIAIAVIATSDSFKASWVHVEDVNLELDTGHVDSWTYGMVMDGDATTSTVAAGSRDHVIRGGRWYFDTHSTAAIRIRAGANIHITDTLIQGSNSDIQIGGKDATHFTSNTLLTSVAAGAATLDLGQAQFTACTGCQLSTIVTTSDTVAVQYVGGSLSVAPTFLAGGTSHMAFYNGHLYLGGSVDLEITKIDGATNAVKLDTSTAGANAYLAFADNDTTKWTIGKLGSDLSFVISSAAGQALSIAQATGVSRFTQGMATTIIQPTYGTPVTIDFSLGNIFLIVVTNNANFTIANPTNGTAGQYITIGIQNASGGAMGTVTWSGNYKFAGGAAPTNPADTTNRSVFGIAYGNGNGFRELSRTSGDVPN